MGSKKQYFYNKFYKGNHKCFKPYHHNMCDESIKGLLKDALTTSIVLIVNMEIEFQQVSNGIKVLNEFDVELLLLEQNMQ